MLSLNILIDNTRLGPSFNRYGAILEKFQKQDPSLIGRIRGCIVDSAPVAAPDPQVNNARNCVILVVDTNNLLCYIQGIIRPSYVIYPCIPFFIFKIVCQCL